MKILDLIFAGRPLLHLPVWSIYLVSLHYHLELSGESFARQDLLTLVLLSLLSAGAYYLNQIHDVESDDYNRKLGFLQRGYVTERGLILAFVITSAVPLVAAFFVSRALLFIFAQLLVLSYLYSAPPARLKDRAFLGLIANAYSFGFLIPFTVMPDFNQHTAGLLGWDNPLYFFLAVASIYLMTTIPDREGDRAAGKRTLGVVWAPFAVKIIAMVLMLLAAAVAFRSNYSLLFYVALISLLPMVFCVILAVPPLERMAAKLPILLLTLLAGGFFPLYFVFLVVLFVATRIYYVKRFEFVYPRLM